MKERNENGAKALLKRIEETPFFAHYSLLGDGNIRHYDWQKLATKITGLEKKLWQFLLLGESLNTKEAKDLLGVPAINFLKRHKLCEISADKVSMGKVRMVRHGGLTFFVERGVITSSYIGDDAKALLACVPRLNKGRCLSLYTAGGFEVMPLVASSNIEIVFASTKANEDILRANLELNAAVETPPCWNFSRNGSGSYDLIVSTPPCYFQPPGIKMPKFVAGGSDGLKCVRKVLEAASTELALEGVALMTFAFFAEADAAGMEKRLRAVLDPYGLNYLVAVSSKLLMEPGVPVFNHMITSSTAGTQADVSAVIEKTLQYINRRQFGAVHLLKARLWKSKKGPPDRQITNYSDSYYGTWII
jgi:hypothetical protein